VNLILPAWTLCLRELVRFYRQKSRMIGVIGSPLLFWFFIGSGLGNSFRHADPSASGSYLEYFFPGTMILIILFTSIFSTISIIEDKKEGFMQSVIVAPVPRTSIALGKIMGGTLLSLLQSVILLIIAPFIGIHMTPASFGIVLAALFLVAFELTGLGFVIAWMMDSTQGFHAIMNLFLIPLWLLSGSLFPVSGAAGWLQSVMRLNPLTYGVEAVREALYLGSNGGTQELGSWELCLTVTAVFALLSLVASAIVVARPSRS
jgi:ABC-2 type transport system permease protein